MVLFQNKNINWQLTIFFTFMVINGIYKVAKLVVKMLYFEHLYHNWLKQNGLKATKLHLRTLGLPKNPCILSVHNFSPYNKQINFLAVLSSFLFIFRLPRKSITGYYGLGSLYNGNEIRPKINILKHEIMIDWHIIFHLWLICVSTNRLCFP